MIRFRNCFGNLAGARRPLAGLIILALALGLVLPQAAQAAYVWKAIGSLNVARSHHTATRLKDGRILVVGGLGNGNITLDSAEVYDPATDKWTLTTPMSTPRVRHTVTLMPNGKVLVAGGNSGSQVLSSAEVFDPAAMAFTPTPSMGTAREYHVAACLANGNVLIAGGQNNAAALANPGQTPAAEGDNERVFLDITQLYRMNEGDFVPGGKMLTPAARAAIAPYGDIFLILGGTTTGNPPQILNTIQAYNPNTNLFFGYPPLGTARYGLWAYPLKDGSVIIGSGRTASGWTNTTEIFQNQQWTAGPPVPGTIVSNPTVYQDLAADIIYFLGGLSDDMKPQGATYSFSDGQWYREADVPEPVANMAAFNANFLAIAGGDGEFGKQMKAWLLGETEPPNSTAALLLLLGILSSGQSDNAP